MPLKKSALLDIQITTAGWRKIPRLRARLEKAAKATLAHVPERYRFPVTVTLLLTSDVAIRRLNRDFRGIDKPTDVLSFPQFMPRELSKKGRNKEPVYLGDMAIAYQYIVANAKNDHKILINHAVHLLIHGILHLFGYDHQTEAEAHRMERLEKRIMADLGLPDPYRSPAKTPGKK